MIDETLSTSEVLVSLETALKVELAPDTRVVDLVEAAVNRLENTYNVEFNKDIFTLMEESILVSDQLSLLMRDIVSALSRLSLLTDLKLFHKNIAFNLADINYIGYDRNQLLTALRYLQDKDMYRKHADELMPPLYEALNNIGMCTAKRLFILLLMCHRIGVDEGVSCLARLLYIGGLVV